LIQSWFENDDNTANISFELTEHLFKSKSKKEVIENCYYGKQPTLITIQSFIQTISQLPLNIIDQQSIETFIFQVVKLIPLINFQTIKQYQFKNLLNSEQNTHKKNILNHLFHIFNQKINKYAKLNDLNYFGLFRCNYIAKVIN
jgi:hypothetical protein